MNAKRVLSALLSAIMVLSMMVPVMAGGFVSNTQSGLTSTGNGTTINNGDSGSSNNNSTGNIYPSLPGNPNYTGGPSYTVGSSEITGPNTFFGSARVSVSGETTAKPGDTVNLFVTINISTNNVTAIESGFNLFPTAQYEITNINIPNRWYSNSSVGSFSAYAENTNDTNYASINHIIIIA